MLFRGCFCPGTEEAGVDDGDRGGRLGERGGVSPYTGECFYGAGGCKAYAKGMFFMCNRMIIVEKGEKMINYYPV